MLSKPITGNPTNSSPGMLTYKTRKKITTILVNSLQHRRELPREFREKRETHHGSPPDREFQNPLILENRTFTPLKYLYFFSLVACSKNTCLIIRAGLVTLVSLYICVLYYIVIPSDVHLCFAVVSHISILLL